MSVLGYPRQAVLEGGNLQPDQAVQYFLDRVVQNRAAKSRVERLAHLVHENIERVVDCGGAGVDPAQDVVVDLTVHLADGAIDALGPRHGGVLERSNNIASKVSDLFCELGSLVLDSLQQEILTEAGEETCDAESQQEKHGD